MKRFYNFIAKHHTGLSLLGLFSVFPVADSEPLAVLGWLPVPLILFGLGAWGKRIKEKQENEES